MAYWGILIGTQDGSVQYHPSHSCYQFPNRGRSLGGSSNTGTIWDTTKPKTKDFKSLGGMDSPVLVSL